MRRLEHFRFFLLLKILSIRFQDDFTNSLAPNSRDALRNPSLVQFALTLSSYKGETKVLSLARFKSKKLELIRYCEYVFTVFLHSGTSSSCSSLVCVAMIYHSQCGSIRASVCSFNVFLLFGSARGHNTRLLTSPPSEYVFPLGHALSFDIHDSRFTIQE